MGRASVLSLVVVCFTLTLRLRVSNANTEGDALYAFKQALSDPQDVLENWDPTLVNPCTWEHVQCDSSSNVVRMEVYSNKINGSIPKQLGQLTQLVSLDLYDNDLTGKIPKELDNLNNLMFLRLYDNADLLGTVPEALACKPILRPLNVTGTKLDIPAGCL
ncbi:leucine-rich repeat protein kinase family protein [Striga asiatica]|uniref:Leucine-rich repeat protein kinase family protein n=1 Tax=Striga asiatica TaxID=4170 RepID=A0A5A7Q6M3_STRAF|nr:leucine-rich repeat protein kinase family protein [Striga asiatica]